MPKEINGILVIWDIEIYDISFNFKLKPKEISYEDKTINYTLEIDNEEVEEWNLRNVPKFHKKTEL